MTTPTFAIETQRGLLTVTRRFLSGTEVVLRGEEELSRQWPWWVFRDHRFRLPDDPDAECHLRLGGRWGYSLWRDDVLLAHRQSALSRFGQAVGVSIPSLLVLDLLLRVESGPGGVRVAPSGPMRWFDFSFPLLVVLLAWPVSWWLGRRLRRRRLAETAAG